MGVWSSGLTDQEDHAQVPHCHHINSETGGRGAAGTLAAVLNPPRQKWLLCSDFQWPFFCGDFCETHRFTLKRPSLLNETKPAKGNTN
jgi:hypothetical protein